MRILIAGLLGAALSACGTAADHPPLADSVMVAVLAELHLADARAEVEGNVPPAIRDSVLARHGLDSARYAAALQYYVAHPDTFEALYGRVVDRLEAERLPLSSEPPPGRSDARD
jgi:hypothetical protein